MQQAACSLIAAEDTAVVRLRIGRRLLPRLQLATAAQPVQGAEDHLFDVVDHLNQGRALISDPAERHLLATLNRRAGDIARARAAFSAAADYFNASLDLFDEATDSQEVGRRCCSARRRRSPCAAGSRAPRSASSGSSAAPARLCHARARPACA